MEVRFECECYDRTLVVNFPTKRYWDREEIMEYLDQYYNEWIFFETEAAEEMCLEECMMYRLTEQYDISLDWYVEED